MPKQNKPRRKIYLSKLKSTKSKKTTILLTESQLSINSMLEKKHNAAPSSSKPKNKNKTPHPLASLPTLIMIL